MNYKLTFNTSDDELQVVVLATEGGLADSIKAMLKVGFVLVDIKED